MEFVSKYVAKIPDKNGYIDYTEEENFTWNKLITRQLKIVQNTACEQYLQGIDSLNFSHDRIPQCFEINTALKKTTGWAVEPVAALISTDHFFTLLARRKFPAACFIRTLDELDYLQEPDIFHEFFGHCPLLTQPAYADFMQQYGKIALAANKQQRELLGRLYWFTIEFGLLKTAEGMRCYGGGILSSKEETLYSVESPVPQRKPLKSGLDALRTPYRIDILQPIYYYIETFDELFKLIENDMIQLVNEASQLPEFEPLFEPLDNNLKHNC